LHAKSCAAAVARLLFVVLLALDVVLSPLGGMSPSEHAMIATSAGEEASSLVAPSKADAAAGAYSDDRHSHDPALATDHVHEAMVTETAWFPARAKRRTPGTWPAGEELSPGRQAVLERPPRLPA
jgi:hypothetical protein